MVEMMKHLSGEKDFKNDRTGMVQVIEFILVFTIFVILLGAFFSAIATQIPSNNLKDVDTRLRAEQICETLVRDTGIMSDGDRNWELREIPEINYGNSPLNRLGLARDVNSYGVLSLSKIKALDSKVLYSRMSEILNLPSGLLINITIRTLEPLDTDTDLKVEWGAIRTVNSKNFVSYTKVVIVDNGLAQEYGLTRPDMEKAEITVTLFYTGKIL
jgi:hypothetical protein